MSFGLAVQRLQPDPIIDSVPDPLFAADVSLSRLVALVPEEVLNLLDLTASVMTETSARTPKVMGSNTRQAAIVADGRDN